MVVAAHTTTKEIKLNYCQKKYKQTKKVNPLSLIWPLVAVMNVVTRYIVVWLL